MSLNGKKILFVTESLARGGMETVLVTISNALSQQGFDVTILCYDPRDDLKQELNSSVRYIYKPRREFNLMNKIPQKPNKKRLFRGHDAGSSQGIR